MLGGENTPVGWLWRAYWPVCSGGGKVKKENWHRRQLKAERKGAGQFIRKIEKKPNPKNKEESTDQKQQKISTTE